MRTALLVKPPGNTSEKRKGWRWCAIHKAVHSGYCYKCGVLAVKKVLKRIRDSQRSVG